MTNKEKALALINTFTTGDTEKAKELLAPGYIQHNLAFGTGADAFVAAVAGLAQAPVKIMALPAVKERLVEYRQLTMIFSV